MPTYNPNDRWPDPNTYGGALEYNNPGNFQFDPLTGMPIGTRGRPGADQALAFQYRADQVINQRRQALWGDAANSMNQASSLFQRYRPGGSAALASGVFAQRAGIYQNWANSLQSPDLMSEYRHDMVIRAQRAARRASEMQLAGSVLNAAATLFAPMMAPGLPGAGGAMGYGEGAGAYAGANAAQMGPASYAAGGVIENTYQSAMGQPQGIQSAGSQIGRQVGGGYGSLGPQGGDSGIYGTAQSTYGSQMGQDGAEGRQIAKGSSGQPQGQMAQQGGAGGPQGQGAGPSAGGQAQGMGAGPGYGGLGQDNLFTGASVAGSQMRAMPHMEPVVAQNVVSDPYYIRTTILRSSAARQRLLNAMAG